MHLRLVKQVTDGLVKKNSLVQRVTAEALSGELEGKGIIVIPLSRPLADGRNSMHLSNDILSIQKSTRLEIQRDYIPNVIEPSFGIRRILYCPMEHGKMLPERSCRCFFLVAQPSCPPDCGAWASPTILTFPWRLLYANALLATMS